MSMNQYSDSNNSKKKKTENLRRFTLFHATTPEEAEQIILKQNFNNVDYPGIRFDFTLERAQSNLRVYCFPKMDNKSTILVADVLISEYFATCELYDFVKLKNKRYESKIDIDKLKKKGYDSILLTGCKFKTIFCLDEKNISNIKYTYGQRPNAFFKINNSRITLFKYVSSKDAKNICSK